MLVIVHSGQTGVERGAHRAAIAARLPVTGFMPPNRRDEFGRIPDDIAHLLTPHVDNGPRQAVVANITLASGVVVVVPNASTPEMFTGMGALLQSIRSARVKSIVCDATTNLQHLAQWAEHLRKSHDTPRIMVTGPRGTRWLDGESLGRRVVFAIGVE